MVGGNADGLADRRNATGTLPGRLRMGQCCFGIVVKEFAGCDQVAGHRVRGGLVQRQQLRADIGGELLGLDGTGDRRAGMRRGLGVAAVLRLSPTGPIRAGSPRSGGALAKRATTTGI